ncbi:MAG: hypothetical protein AABZ30_10260 [Myxococcota bacterium]
MAVLARFWRQENRRYRDMQLALTPLTLNFLIPSLTYFFAPESALAQFRAMAGMLGGGDFPHAEQSDLWRVLASANVFTLGVICLLLQLDVRRFAAVIPVFAVLKGFAALGFLWVWAVETRYPLFLAAFFLDAASVVIVAWFAGRAARSLGVTPSPSDDRLVPRLRRPRVT